MSDTETTSNKPPTSTALDQQSIDRSRSPTEVGNVANNESDKLDTSQAELAEPSGEGDTREDGADGSQEEGNRTEGDRSDKDEGEMDQTQQSDENRSLSPVVKQTDQNEQKEVKPKPTYDQQQEEDMNLKRKLDAIEDEETPLFERLGQLTDLVNSERDQLLDTPLKDYTRTESLKSVMTSSVHMMRQMEDKMMEINGKMKEVTGCLEAMKRAVDKKITSEGLLTWAEQLKTDPSDPESVAREKMIVSEAAEAKVVLSKATSNVPKAEQKAAELALQAAEAAAEANKAQQQAEESRIAAEAARKAVERKRIEEEEARRKAEEERKRKEEEEQKQREEEERRRMEEDLQAGTPEERERKRLEAERRNPKSWPNWVFSVDPGSSGIPIGCVIRAMADTAAREDITVEKIEQLSGVFQLSENEELVSNIIQITHTNPDFKTMEPLAIALPQCAPRNLSRECVIKALQPTGHWLEVATNDVSFDDMKEYKFVECRLQKVTSLAVVTRIKREQHTVHKRGGKVTSSVDSRVCFTVRQSMFKVSTTVSVEVSPVESSLVSDIRHRKPNCTGLMASSPIVKFQTPLRKFPKSIMVNIPLPQNPSKVRQRPATASSGSKSTNTSQGTNNRPKSSFTSSYVKQDEEEEDTVHLLTPDADGQWTVVENIQLVQPKNKDIVTFEMDKPMSKFIILRTKQEVLISGIEKIPSDIETALRERIVQVVLRQNNDDANNIIIQCNLATRIESTIRKLSNKGYDYGPLPSPDIIMYEGQPITLSFRGNITSENSAPAEIVFNSHIKTKTNFQVEVLDKFAQKSIECFRGFVQLFKVVSSDVQQAFEETNQVERKVTQQLLTEQLINLPKPEAEAPKPIVERAPVNVKADGLINKDMLQQLASELGDEWKKLAHYLNVKKVRIQAIQRNNVNRDTEHAIYEMLLTWIKRVPKSANKVDILCHALVCCGRVDQAEIMKDKEIDFKRDRSRSARDSYLRKAFVKIAQSPHVVSDWKFLARQLELREIEIAEVDDAFSGIREKCFHSLIKWRETFGDEATPDTLKATLKKCKYFHVADQVQDILKEAV